MKLKLIKKEISMSEKIDSEPVEKEKSVDITTPEAVSNGIEDKKKDNLNKSIHSPPLKVDREKSASMTNKDVPIKPSHRTQRLRSRSKSSNSEELKPEKPSAESTSDLTDEPNATPERKSDEIEQINVTKTESESSSKIEEEDPANKVNEVEAAEQSSETAMDTDEPVEAKDTSKESILSEEPTTSPMAVDDENSSDFLGFSTPEDKYTKFSVVFSPFEVKVEKSKGTRGKGPNGPHSSSVRLLPLAQRTLRSSPSQKINIHDPEFKKPFEYGWKRELVFRSTGDSSLKRNADVYYYTPNNKKVRSLREVLEYLIPGQGLSGDNFTFSKEPIGLDDPEKEIIREAKYIKPNRSSDDGFYTLVVKSTAKQRSAAKNKERKEVNKDSSIELSPSSSPGTSANSPLTPRIVMKTNSSFKANSKKMTIKVEKRRKTAGPDDSSPLDSVENDWSPEPKTQTNGLKRGGSDAGSGSDGSPPAKMSAVSPKSAPSVKQVGIPKPAPKVALAPKQSGAKSPAQPVQAVIQPTSAVPQSSVYVDFMNFGNAWYTALLHTFQYLKVHELLRAACVSKTWRDIATHRSLWETVKMKNSRVRNWEGFGRSLRHNGTRCVDLKKMLVPDGSDSVGDMWNGLVKALESVPSLVKLDVGRCTPDNLELIAKACPQLESIVALSIRGHNLDLNTFKSEKLVELKLKSVGGMEINNFSALKNLTNLKYLSLTSIKKLVGLENCLPSSLETLELGECCQMSDSFATDTLPSLVNLTRLRLEKGQGMSCPTVQLIDAISDLEKLGQLELINFDIKPGFDKALAKCVHIKTLLIIPTYVTQSATTNHVVIGGVSKLSATLDYFIWGLTLELLRVTDLFIDQVEGQKQKAQAKKGAGDSIPILKPLSDETSEPSREGQTTSQVDILALPKLQKVLSTLLPTTRVKILKVPFSATWRQTVD